VPSWGTKVYTGDDGWGVSSGEVGVWGWLRSPRTDGLGKNSEGPISAVLVGRSLKRLQPTRTLSLGRPVLPRQAP
jgi:hypothetical protein